MIVTAGIFLAGSSVAAPRETPIAAGEKGKLTVEVVQSGPVVRRLKLEMNLVSQETLFMSSLGDTPVEGLSERVDYDTAVMESRRGDQEKLFGLMETLATNCEKNEESAACLATKREIEELQARLERTAAEAEAGAPPTDMDQNRFQGWTGDPTGAGCGVLTSTVGTKTRRLVATADTAADKEEFNVCYSAMSIDRRKGEVYLKLMPVSVNMPGEELGTFDFLDFNPSPGVKPDRGFVGTLPSVILGPVPTKGNERSFTAETAITAEGAPPAIVSIRFEAR